jgi:hypothetical protein
MIVDHEWIDAPGGRAGLIWNHFKFLTQGLRLPQSID